VYIKRDRPTVDMREVQSTKRPKKKTKKARAAKQRLLLPHHKRERKACKSMLLSSIDLGLENY
jgi:hypothetical protein